MIRLLVLLLGISSIAHGEHAGLNLFPRTPAVVPAPITPDITTRAAGDLTGARWTSLGRTKTWEETYEGCARKGMRVPNLQEVQAGFASAQTWLPAGATMWTSTRVTRYRHRGAELAADGSYKQSWSIDNDETYWGICVGPREPMDEIIAMCPVGNMNYCDKFMCGNYSLAFSRCLRNRMGRKSWQVYQRCGGVFSGWKHAINLITLPSVSQGRVQYCLVDPQHLYPDSTYDRTMRCWTGFYNRLSIPTDIKTALCDGETTNNYEIEEVGHVFWGNPDFSRNEEVFRDVLKRTGIPREILQRD